jgi:hypothetical protein
MAMYSSNCMSGDVHCNVAHSRCCAVAGGVVHSVHGDTAILSDPQCFVTTRGAVVMHSMPMYCRRELCGHACKDA